MNYYRRFPGDYLNDTMHLSGLQDGMYGRLLDRYYASELPLPSDREKLYSLVRANSHEDRAAVESVLAEFFRETARGFVNNRAKKEIERCNKISATRASVGKQGGKAKAIAKQLQSKSLKSQPQTLDSRLQTPDAQPVVVEVSSSIRSVASSESARQTPPSDHFDEFWSVYPKKVAKIDARKAWARIAGANSHSAEIIAGVEAWKSSGNWDDPQYVPDPARFLRSRRWEDEIPVPGGKNGRITDGISDTERRNFQLLGVGYKSH